MSLLKECIQSVVFPIEIIINHCGKEKKKKSKKQNPKKKYSKMAEYYDEKILDKHVSSLVSPILNYCDSLVLKV